MPDIPDGEHIDDDGIDYFGFPGLHVNTDDSETTQESHQNGNQNVHQIISKRATWKARKPDKAKQGGSYLELKAILRRTFIMQMKTGCWRTMFKMKGGITTTRKSTLEVASNILKKGNKPDEKTGKIDARYTQWRKFIKTYPVAVGYTSPTYDN